MSLLPLITEPSELAAQLDADNLLILDLRDASSYLAGHIPNAVHFTLGDVVHSAPPTGGLLPDAAQISSALSRVGYTKDKHIVAVDDNGGPQAARLIWTLHAFGITDTSFLNGGMIGWQSDIGATDKTTETPESSNYEALLDGSNNADRDNILANIDNADRLLLDARTAGEYNGTDLRSARGGHIPGAIHFEWSQLKQSNMKLKPMNEMQQLLEDAGFIRDKEIVAYCQTHMRSSVVWLVMTALGYPNAKGYAGAWSDWGNQTDTPIE